MRDPVGAGGGGDGRGLVTQETAGVGLDLTLGHVYVDGEGRGFVLRPGQVKAVEEEIETPVVLGADHPIQDPLGVDCSLSQVLPHPVAEEGRDKLTATAKTQR